MWLKNQRIRLIGIDTPESRTRDEEEKKFGLLAKEEVIKHMANCTKFKSFKDEKGKFGRILGEMWRTTNYADKSINEYMIEKFHAVAYFGQSKEEIEARNLKIAFYSIAAYTLVGVVIGVTLIVLSAG